MACKCFRHAGRRFPHMMNRSFSVMNHVHFRTPTSITNSVRVFSRRVFHDMVYEASRTTNQKRIAARFHLKILLAIYMRRFCRVLRCLGSLTRLLCLTTNAPLISSYMPCIIDLLANSSSWTACALPCHS